MIFLLAPDGERPGEGSTLRLVPFPGGEREDRERAPLEGCARGFGIEKALALRRGIKRIHYSKTSVIVEFVCDPAFDGKTESEAVSSSPVLRVAPTDSPPRTPETKEPTPGLGVSSSARFASLKWCPFPNLKQAHHIEFLNTFHNYRLAMGLPV